jgi:hypothetical protein
VSCVARGVLRRLGVRAVSVPPPRATSRRSPLAPTSNEGVLSVLRRTRPLRDVPRSVTGSLHTQVDAGRRTAALKPVVPSLRPGYKGRASAVPAQAAEQPVLPVPRRRRVLAPRGSGAKEPPKCLPYVPPNLPGPLVCQPRHPSRRSRSSSSNRRQPPPSSLTDGLTAPSLATNRAPVSPSSFPTSSPAKGTAGAAQFRRAALPSMPRTTLRHPRSFQGVLCEWRAWL